MSAAQWGASVVAICGGRIRQVLWCSRFAGTTLLHVRIPSDRTDAAVGAHLYLKRRQLRQKQVGVETHSAARESWLAVAKCAGIKPLCPGVVRSRPPDRAAGGDRYCDREV